MCTCTVCTFTVCTVLCNAASSEDSDSADSESSLGENKAQDSATVQQPARVLSDEELNQLGAKILRAEMMGDEVACLLSRLISVFLRITRS